MRLIFLGMFFFLNLTLIAQSEQTLLEIIKQSQKQKYSWKERILPAAAFYTAGFSDGISQMLQFHYWDFKKIFPKANDQFWNPDISWINKYARDKEGNLIRPLKERFPLAKTALVWSTDGFHFTRTTTRLFNTIGVITSIGQKRPWWHYLLDIFIYTTIRNIGFHSSYTILPKLFD